MRADELLRSVGVSRSYLGFPYFVSAVEMVLADENCLQDMRGNIYRPLSLQYGVGIRNVERNIRTIRDVILRNGTGFLTYLTHGQYSEDMKMYPREIIEVCADFVRAGDPLPEEYTHLLRP